MAKKIIFTAEIMDDNTIHYESSMEGRVNLIEQLGVLQAFMYMNLSQSDLNQQKPKSNGKKKIR